MHSGIYQFNYRPQLRDTDTDYRIGMRGFLEYICEAGTSFLHELGRGMDVLPDLYGINWMITKYSLRINRKAELFAPITITARVTKLDRVRLWEDVEIRQNSVCCAIGRVEFCLFHIGTSKVARIREIRFPELALHAPSEKIPDFQRLPKETEAMTDCHTQTVRYCNLDVSHHMNNLQHIYLLMDAFGPDFYETHPITSFEMHYLSQAYYGDSIRVKKQDTEGGCLLAAVRSDGTLLDQAVMTFD